MRSNWYQQNIGGDIIFNIILITYMYYSNKEGLIVRSEYRGLFKQGKLSLIEC